MMLPEIDPGDLLRAWFEADPDPCLIVRTDRKVLFANSEAELLRRTGSFVLVPSGRLHMPGTSASKDFEHELDALRCGAAQRGAVILQDGRQNWRLLHLQRMLVGGEVVIGVRFGPSTTTKLNLDVLARHCGLSAMEQRVLAAVVQGMQAKAIASEFSISPNTVRSHLRSVFSRLNVRSQLEAQRLVFHVSPREMPAYAGAALGNGTKHPNVIEDTGDLDDAVRR